MSVAGLTENINKSAGEWFAPSSTMCQQRSFWEIFTTGLGLTRFYFDPSSSSIPVRVEFADGTSLLRQLDTWTCATHGQNVPWHGHVRTCGEEAIIQAGAVTDVLKMDGSHIRFLGDKIVMIVTKAGDVLEFEYQNEKLEQVNLDGYSYIESYRKRYRLVNSCPPVFGIPKISEHGFVFDAEWKHGYSDHYFTNGNLTTMRNGVSKFTFGVSRM